MKIVPVLVMAALLFSCSHSYDSDILDLGTYQWNMWLDKGAVGGADSLYRLGADLSTLPLNAPRCGWDELHRGKGKLVRIPALNGDHFPEATEGRVTWFHCRHTLPELWAGRDISLSFEGISHRAEIYLNEKLVGAHLGENSSFLIDITSVVYYTRDNHLSIRVYDPDPGSGGITGKVSVVSEPGDQIQGER